MERIIINHKWRCPTCGIFIGEDYNKCPLCEYDKDIKDNKEKKEAEKFKNKQEKNDI